MGLEVSSRGLRYLSESFDRVGGVHVVAAIFEVEFVCELAPPTDPKIVARAWVARAELGAQLAVRVVREPLLANLAGDKRRYYAFAEAGISVAFADEP